MEIAGGGLGTSRVGFPVLEVGLVGLPMILGLLQWGSEELLEMRSRHWGQFDCHVRETDLVSTMTKRADGGEKLTASGISPVDSAGSATGASSS